MIIGLQIAAMSDQSSAFYAILRWVMPVLAAITIVDALNRDMAALWVAGFALAGLFFIPGDRWPRLMWIPINIGVAGLYLGYLGQIIYVAVIG
jgi:hypothetical protein